MPNHIVSIIRTTDRAPLLAMVDDDNKVDFNNIIPQPDNIEREACSSRNTKAIDANGDTYHPETGKVCWYDWNVEHWGTKWGGYETEFIDDGYGLKFQTAWAHPTPVVEKLSQMFPETLLSVEYADEDLGSNVGTYTILNGETADYRDLSGTIAGAELACQLHFGTNYRQYRIDRLTEEIAFYDSHPEHANDQALALYKAELADLQNEELAL